MLFTSRNITSIKSQEIIILAVCSAPCAAASWLKWVKSVRWRCYDFKIGIVILEDQDILWLGTIGSDKNIFKGVKSFSLKKKPRKLRALEIAS